MKTGPVDGRANPSTFIIYRFRSFFLVSRRASCSLSVINSRLRNLGQGHPGEPGNWRWPWTTLIDDVRDNFVWNSLLLLFRIFYCAASRCDTPSLTHLTDWLSDLYHPQDVTSSFLGALALYLRCINIIYKKHLPLKRYLSSTHQNLSLSLIHFTGIHFWNV